jgi:hypothetical protein
MNAALRWLLALIGAGAASVVGFTVSIWIVTALAAIAGKALSSGPPPVTFVVASTLSFLGWVWAGSAIVPSQHRRIALVVFPTPVVLIAFASLVLSFSGRMRPETVPIFIGLWLACSGIMILAVRASVLARRKTVEDIVDVFSDKPGRKLTPQK